MELRFRPSKPDARLRILQIIIAGFLSFYFKNQWAIFAFYLVINFLILVEYGAKSFFKKLATYIVLNALIIGLSGANVPIISAMFPSFISMIVRVFPVYLLMKLMNDKTPMNELLYSLEVMRIPKSLSIPLMVVYRYIPTILQDFGYVNESLKMRGLNLSPANMGHLIRTLENYIVPLLSRSEKLSEELAAASLCKGLSINRKRSCCTEVKLNKSDLVYFLGMTLLTSVLLYLDFLNF